MSYLDFSTRWDFHQFERFLQGHHGLKPGLGIIGNEHVANYHFGPQDAPNLGFDFVLSDGSVKSFSAKSYRALARMLTSDRDVMLTSVGIIPAALRYASKPLRSDKEVVLVAVKKDPFVLEYAGKDLKEDDEVVLTAVSRDSYVLQYVSDRYRDNDSVMFAAVRENPFSFRYASDRLRDNVMLAYLAVSQRPDVLRHASERIRNNPSLLQQVARERKPFADKSGGAFCLDDQIALAKTGAGHSEQRADRVAELER